MSLEQTAGHQSRKRKRFVSPPPLSNKRRKPTGQEQHQTPSAFWDNLSRLWLTPRALREFDCRTIFSAAPIPPDPSTLQKSRIAQLKRFAGRGGPLYRHLAFRKVTFGDFNEPTGKP
ncbi:hypothetical protein GQ44DRAFT_780441 [Phaeosphaeriaceae sp. PMI808]|nr:hypothetical protein GQ44DRAFT_780441 [Phaeosphaeriaceae sp. PMI808]